MTKEEFYASVESWDDLFRFCHDNDLSSLDDIYAGYSLDERVEDDICERECNWPDLRDALNELPKFTGELYRRVGWLEYVCVDDDFEEWKAHVAREAEEYEAFEEEYQSEEDDYIEDESEVESAPEIAEIIGACQSSLYIVGGTK